MVNHLRDKRVKPYAVLDAVKQHPMIRKLIQGGETKEYSGHLIPEGGFHSIPPLSGDGWCICGDAAQLVNFVHREGTNLAMTPVDWLRRRSLKRRRREIFPPQR